MNKLATQTYVSHSMKFRFCPNARITKNPETTLDFCSLGSRNIRMIFTPIKVRKVGTHGEFELNWTPLSLCSLLVLSRSMSTIGRTVRAERGSTC